MLQVDNLDSYDIQMSATAINHTILTHDDEDRTIERERAVLRHNTSWQMKVIKIQEKTPAKVRVKLDSAEELYDEAMATDWFSARKRL